MRATVGQTSSEIVANDRPTAHEAASRNYLVKNQTASASVFVEILEDEATVADSFEWEPTDPALVFSLEPGESCKAITLGADQVLHILGQGR